MVAANNGQKVGRRWRGNGKSLNKVAACASKGPWGMELVMGDGQRGVKACKRAKMIEVRSRFYSTWPCLSAHENEHN